jgi:hypothetical protein
MREALMLGRFVSKPVSITTNDLGVASPADAEARDPRAANAENKTARTYFIYRD